MKSSIVLFAFLFVFLSSAAFPQLAGDYYIPQGGHPQGFATLAAACSAITASGVSAPVRFLIDADLAETGANLVITTTTITATNTLTILPNTGASHTITITGCSSSGSNGYAGFTISGTNYVTVDGSNGAGSGLTFTVNDATNGSYVILINNGGSNNTIQNCSINFTAMPLSGTYGVYVGANAVPVPNNVTVQNNNIAQTGSLPQYGIYFQGSFGPPILGYGGKIINNKVYSYQAGVTLNDVGTADAPFEVSGNTFVLGSVTATSYVEALFLAYDGGTINIFNNKILSLTTNAAAGSGLLGMAIYGAVSTTAPPVYNIYNNFISGFTINSTAYSGPVYGIWFENSGDQIYTANVYYNTIYINSTGGKATGTQVAAVGRTSNLIHVNMTLKDNILYNDNNTATSFAVNFPGTGPLVSNNNDLYVSGTGNIGYYNAGACLDLATWRTASSNDANSVSKQTFFVSNTSPYDLHLTGTSNGDVSLAGVPISGITTDIDGQTRNASFPYMGADEAPISLPVELTSFTARLNGNSVVLNWNTATEINNNGFEIERSLNSVSWEKIGFLKGAGNSISANNYSFTDASLSKAGIYSYRLKQVDYNGTFKYSNSVEVNYATPTNFSLSQNYPNPFNPNTIINYYLPQASNVKLVVFNPIGQTVKVLENGFMGAGNYSVSFNASELPSGLYFYKIEAGQFSQTKKMMLMK